MRIVGGAWRGRRLTAPPGAVTRPTADRVRQALFDRLAHATWARAASGAPILEGAAVLDVFAGTGAFGLEALSRGAACAVFLERDHAALTALRANVAACGAGEQCRVLAADALRPPRGSPATIAFLDPPYGQGLLTASVAALTGAGWLAPGSLIVAELGADEAPPTLDELAAWTHGTAQMIAWRLQP